MLNEIQTIWVTILLKTNKFLIRKLLHESNQSDYKCSKILESFCYKMVLYF